VAGAWLTEPARRSALVIALNLVPFAGIAFLWFLGVVRDRLGSLEDRFFTSVLLGSGLLFTAMLFAGSALAGGLIASSGSSPDALGPDTIALGRHVTTVLLRVYAMRMAAVFVMSTATIILRTGVAPRWLGILGVLVGVVLLTTSGLTLWVALLFPGWILLLSLDILSTGLRQQRGDPELPPSPGQDEVVPPGGS
jgi:hypothetical protein